MNAAIIVAAGRGTRMGPEVDKLLLPVAGIPVVVHTWRRFNDADCIDQIVLVVREGMETTFARLAELHCLSKPHRFVAGGAERQDSVWNGLQALSPETRLVLALTVAESGGVLLVPPRQDPPGLARGVRQAGGVLAGRHRLL